MAIATDYQDIRSVTSILVPTRQAAHYLGRSPKTLNQWASYGGPVTPVRINGRLGWPVDQIKKLLGV